MDFNKFNTVAAAEKGADCHIKCPVTLKPLFDNPDDPYVDNGKPCMVELLGGEAPSVRAALREQQKARASASDADGNDESSIDDLHQRMVEVIAPRVIGFKNIRNGDKPAAKEDAAWFFNLNRINGVEGEKSFVEQAVEFSGRRANFLGNVSSA